MEQEDRHMNVNVSSSGQGTKTVILQIPKVENISQPGPSVFNVSLSGYPVKHETWKRKTGSEVEKEKIIVNNYCWVWVSNIDIHHIFIILHNFNMHNPSFIKTWTERRIARVPGQ